MASSNYAQREGDDADEGNADRMQPITSLGVDRRRDDLPTFS